MTGRIIQFRTRAQEPEKRSVAARIAAPLAVAGTAAGFYAYHSRNMNPGQRAWARQSSYANNRAKIAARGGPRLPVKPGEEVLGKFLKPSAAPSPAAPFDYGVKPKPAMIKRAKPKPKPKPKPQPAQVKNAPIKPKAKVSTARTPVKRAVVQTRRFSAILTTRDFVQGRFADNTFAPGGALASYRKAQRIVPWVNRASETAQDVGDIASGRKVEKPFYKKPWFSRAAKTVAIAAPLYLAKTAYKGARHTEERGPGWSNTGSRADKVSERLGKTKVGRVLARNLAAHQRLIEFAREREERPRSRLPAIAALGLTGVAAGTGVAALRSARRAEKSVSSAANSVKATSDTARDILRQAKTPIMSAATSVKAASEATRSAVKAQQAAKGSTWLRRRLGLSARITPIQFAYADALDRGWDLRDARGRSARVYAPGAGKRQRRKKEWDEKVDNIRLVRNIAVGAAAAGIGTSAYLGLKLRKSTPKPLKAGASVDPFSATARVPKVPTAKSLPIKPKAPAKVGTITEFPRQKRA